MTDTPLDAKKCTYDAPCCLNMHEQEPDDNLNCDCPCHDPEPRP